MPSGASPWAARRAAVLNEPFRRLPEMPITFMAALSEKGLFGTRRPACKPARSVAAARPGNVFVKPHGYSWTNDRGDHVHERERRAARHRAESDAGREGRRGTQGGD